MKNKNITLFNKKYSIKKMVISWLILLPVYLYAGHFFVLDSLLPKPWNTVIYLLIDIIIAVLCLKISCTTKVFEKRFKFNKASLALVIITFILFGIFFIITKLLGWVEVFTSPISHMTMSICVALGAGICEEFLFRNLAFNTCLAFFKNEKYNLFYASVVSSALFGLMHLVNITHQSWLATSEQIFYAFTLGLTFMMIHLITNNMKVTPILHFLFDLSPLIVSGSAPALSWNAVLSVFGPFLILSLVSLWLMNRSYLQKNY